VRAGEFEMPGCAFAAQHHAVESVVIGKTAKDFEAETVAVEMEQTFKIIRWARHPQNRKIAAHVS
jgi:hypothetical protein